MPQYYQYSGFTGQSFHYFGARFPTHPPWSILKLWPRPGMSGRPIWYIFVPITKVEYYFLILVVHNIIFYLRCTEYYFFFGRIGVVVVAGIWVWDLRHPTWDGLVVARFARWQLRSNGTSRVTQGERRWLSAVEGMFDAGISKIAKLKRGFTSFQL